MNECRLCLKPVNQDDLEDLKGYFKNDEIYCMECCIIMNESKEAEDIENTYREIAKALGNGGDVNQDIIKEQEFILKNYKRDSIRNVKYVYEIEGNDKEVKNLEKKIEEFKLENGIEISEDDEEMNLAIALSLSEIKLIKLNSGEKRINEVAQHNLISVYGPKEGSSNAGEKSELNIHQDLIGLEWPNKVGSVEENKEQVVEKSFYNDCGANYAHYKPEEAKEQYSQEVINRIDEPKYNPGFQNHLVSVYQQPLVISQDPQQYYALVKKIGSGSTGQVYLSRKIQTNEYFAIKILDISSPIQKTLIINEINLTINSRHTNIIKYFEYYEISNSIWIVQELMSYALCDIILKDSSRFPEKVSAYILREILKGLNYLHTRHRIHRDIKSDNILVSSEGDIKIADLGFCAQVNDNQPNRETFAGTLLWMAPEILRQNEYDFKIDIWSLGIVAFELGIGEPPYYRLNQQAIVVNILHKEPPRLNDFVSSSYEFNSFIERCLVKDPRSRASTEELLSHPFIANCKCTVEEFRRFLEKFKYD